MKVTAPVRIDISGGWPDSPPYRNEFGGSVLNAAINLRVYAEFKNGQLITSYGDAKGYKSLGASGALDAAWLVARNPELLKDKKNLIKKVWSLENQNIGHRAGMQDQAAGIYGGINLWYFGLENLKNTQLIKSPIIFRSPITPEKAKHLENRLVLIDTCEDHLSSNIHDNVFGPKVYGKNIPKLCRMSEIAREMRLQIDDEQKMSDLINETWDLQKSLHPTIETDKMRQLQEEFKGEYLACRATGAGGGGVMFFYTNNKESFKNLAIPFNFEYEGIKIED
jgi:galactokinase/mevalonate kinase-like predicted kinase